MIWGTLYDIQNHDDFYDSLKIMEATDSNSYDLIFMEMPRITKGALHIYLFSEYRNEQNLEPDFLRKCIENAFRLLKDNGILVFVAPKTNYSNQDYYLPLSQLFPSISELIVYYGEQPHTLVDSFFFCSKRPHFPFPVWGKWGPEYAYPYTDERGSYRLSRLIAAKPHPMLPTWKYEWNGVKLNGEQVWMLPIENLEGLSKQGLIVIENNMVYEKAYRLGNLVRGNAPIWEKKAHKTHTTFHCDSELLSLILSSYCPKNAELFCPFDYDGIFPEVAIEHKMNWTSIRIHSVYGLSRYWDYPNFTYKKFLDIQPKPSQRQYEQDLLLNPSEVIELKDQITELSAPLIDVDIPKDSKEAPELPCFDSEKSAKNIKRLREDVCKFSVEKVVDLFGGEITKQTVYNWESGKNFPKPNHLIKLAAIYGVPNLNEFYQYTTDEPVPKRDKER